MAPVESEIKKTRIREYAKTITIFSAWGIITLSLSFLLKATFMPVVMARGSDMLVNLYRVPNLPANLALILFSGCTLAITSTLLEPFVQVPKNTRFRALVALLPCTFFLSLSFHAITISSKHERPELNEFLGPFLVRSFQAPDQESPIPAYCRNSLVIAVKSGAIEKRIFLGVGYWSIEKNVCSDRRLSPKGG